MVILVLRTSVQSSVLHPSEESLAGDISSVAELAILASMQHQEGAGEMQTLCTPFSDHILTLRARGVRGWLDIGWMMEGRSKNGARVSLPFTLTNQLLSSHLHLKIGGSAH